MICVILPRRPYVPHTSRGKEWYAADAGKLQKRKLIKIGCLGAVATLGKYIINAHLSYPCFCDKLSSPPPLHPLSISVCYQCCSHNIIILLP